MSGCAAFTAATSFFMKMLYADSARGASCGSFGSAALRLRLRFAPAGAAWCASAVGWICTANTALHCEHCTEVIPSGSRTCSCAAHVGQETWNHCIVPAILAV